MKQVKKIGVFFGSRSPEHDISIITGQLVMSGLKGLGYEVVPVYLTKDGAWLLGGNLDQLRTFTFADQSKISSEKLGDFYLDLSASRGQLVFRGKKSFGETIAIDLAFPAFHGSYGEDGTIQGLFEIFDIPYVGCDVTASALTMDKILTKQFYQEQNIPTAKFLHFDVKQWQKDKSKILAEIKVALKWPLFVKPARLGSSIGVAKVVTDEELTQAAEVALHYGERFIVEEAVEALMDITCAVLGNEEPEASLLQESIFSAELFSYADKYLVGGGAQLGKAQQNLVIPARLDERTTAEIRNLSIRIFKVFGCSGIARVDFLYDKKSKQYYANEINTLPGTLYHHLWEKSGIDLPTLLQKLVDLALDRHERKKRVKFSFDSDILKMVNSPKLPKPPQEDSNV
jgi:D-alanine-D-alanine ligase